MLDLALATKLLDTVPGMESARIGLLGDKEQLSAVESGAVFAELSVDPSLSPRCVQELAALTTTPAARIRPPEAVTPFTTVGREALQGRLITRMEDMVL